MMLPPLILEALTYFLSANTTETQAHAQHMFTSLANTPNYAIGLTTIAADSDQEFPVRQAALIQLKNMLKAQWTQPIFFEQKDETQRSLLVEVATLTEDHRLAKLYRDIIVIISNAEKSKFLPAKILSGLLKMECYAPVFHICLGILRSYRSLIKSEEIKLMEEFVGSLLPDLLGCSALQDSMLGRHLFMKFLEAIGRCCLSLSGKVILIRQIPNVLALLSQDRYSQEQVTFFEANQTLERSRQSDIHHYFHARKWAFKLLKRIFDQILWKDVEDAFYHQYGQSIADILFRQFFSPLPKSLAARHIRCVTTFAQNKPSLIAPYALNIQYNVLILAGTLAWVEEESPLEDPIGFLQMEEGHYQSGNVRESGIRLWAVLSLNGSNFQKTDIVVGNILSSNLEVIYQLAHKDGSAEQQIALYLLYSMHSWLYHYPVGLDLVNAVFSHCAPLFYSRQPLLRIRMIGLLRKYGNSISLSNIEKVKSQVFSMVISDRHPTVRMIAGIALKSLLNKKELGRLPQQTLKGLVESLMQMMENYCIDELTPTLRLLIKHYHLELKDQLILIANRLSAVFQKSMEGLLNDERGVMDMAADASLHLLTYLMDLCLPIETERALEQSVLCVLETYFKVNDRMECEEYEDSVMHLLNGYLRGKQKLDNPRFWLFYHFIMLGIVGIPEDMHGQIQELQLPEDLVEVFRRQRNGGFYQLQSVFNVIRNYIQLGQDQQEHKPTRKTNIFKFTPREVLQYLVDSVYFNTKLSSRISPDQLIRLRKFSTMLLICLLQNLCDQVPEKVLKQIWKVVLHNNKSDCPLKKYNLQLFSLLFYEDWPLAIHYLKAHPLHESTNELLTGLLGDNLEWMHKCQESYERRRVIYGGTTLLRHAREMPELLGIAKELFACLCKMTYGNLAYAFLDESNDFEDEHSVGMDSLEEDWEEYESNLFEGQEVDYFLETVDYLSEQDGQLFGSFDPASRDDYLMRIIKKKKEIDKWSQSEES